MKRTLRLAGIVAALVVAGCGDDEKGDPPEKPPPAEGGSGTPPPAPEPLAPTPEPAPADTVERVADEFMVQLDQLGRAFAKVTDAESASKVAEITPLATAAFKSIALRLEKLEVPPKALRDIISAELKTREEKMARKLGGQEDFLNSLDAAVRPIVEKSMKEFSSTMEEIAPVVAKYLRESADPPTSPPLPAPVDPPVAPSEPTPPPSQPVPPPSEPTPAPSNPATPAEQE